MKTRPEIEVFDDPKYCSDGPSDPCSYLEGGFECDLYRDDNGEPVFLELERVKGAERGYSTVEKEREKHAVEDLFVDKDGKSYIDPMHPERGTVG